MGEPADAGAARTIEELRHRIHVMETVFENMSDALVVADENEEYLFRNTGAERIIGTSRLRLEFDRVPEIFGFHTPDGARLMSPDDLPLARAVRRGESSDEVEAFVRNAEKPEGVWVSMNGRPIRDAEGRFRGGVVVIRDVTRLKKAERELARTVTDLEYQTQLPETVFERMREGVIVVDPSARSIIFNPSMVAILGPPQRGLAKNEVSERYGVYRPDQKTFYPPDELPVFRALRGESVEDHRAFVRNARRPGGVWVSSAARPLRDGSGDLIGAVVTVRDVTDSERSALRLRQSHETLQRQSQLMELIFETISDGVIVADEDENYLMRNRSAERITGRYVPGTSFDQVPETYGLFLPDESTLFPPEDLPLTRAVRNGEATDDVEMLVRSPNRPEGRYVSVSGRPLRDENGGSRGGAIVIHDITERKKLELSFRRTLARLEFQTDLMKLVLEGVNDGLVVADETGRYLMHNRSMEEISGLKGEPWDPDLQSESHALYLADGETLLPEDQHPLARAARGEATDEFEALARTKAKPEGVCVGITGKTLRDEGGVIRGGISVYRDLTEIKRAEAALRRTAEVHRMQSQTLESIFNSLGEAVMVTDRQGEIIRFNPAAERIIGVGMVKNRPERWIEPHGVFFPDTVTPVPHGELPHVRILGGDRFDDLELFVRNPRIPDGVYVNINANPIRGPDGEVEGGVIAFRDVTERHMAEEALSEAFAEGRLEILDTLLHNVGNAVNSVATGMGTVQERVRESRIQQRFSALASALEAHREDWVAYLASDPQGQKVVPFILALAEDVREHEEKLRAVLDRVERRVEYIVEVIRTQRTIGSRPTVRKDISLRGAIDAAVNILQESIAKRGIEVRVDCRGTPETIRIHESRFHQMLVTRRPRCASAARRGGRCSPRPPPPPPRDPGEGGGRPPDPVREPPVARPAEAQRRPREGEDEERDGRRGGGGEDDRAHARASPGAAPVARTAPPSGRSSRAAAPRRCRRISGFSRRHMTLSRK